MDFEQVFAETPEIGIVRKIKPDLGLVRDDARLDAPEWSKVIRDLLATEKPSAIVVMLGLNDRLPLRDRIPATKETTTLPDNAHPPATAAETQRQRAGENHEFHTDKWTELYSKRIDDMIAAIKTKGVPIVWVGLPAIRGAKSTSDMGYLNELYRARAEKAGVTYVDLWDGFVDDQGRYAQQGPDFQGQTRRLRTYDGVNFTNYGAEKLAHYVEHELRRVLTSHVLPVALPGPEEQSPAKGAAIARPTIGPVVPLSANGGGEGGVLLGAASHPPEREADPLATRVLNRGDAIVAPPGRADDFSWPRPIPTPAAVRMWGRLPTQEDGSGRTMRTNPRRKGRATPRISRHSPSCRHRPMSRPPSRTVPTINLTVRHRARLCRSAQLLRFRGEGPISRSSLNACARSLFADPALLTWR